MQEEVENRTISLIISGTKFTGRLLKAAISKYLAHRKEVKVQKSRDHPEEHGGQVSMAGCRRRKATCAASPTKPSPQAWPDR